MVFTLSTNPTNDQAMAAVQQALRTGVPVCDYGVAHQSLGHAPPNPHTSLTLDSQGILEHDVADFMVRVSAGCTLGELQQTLAAQNQFLPIDADRDLTIGEIITHNVYGPMRVGFGAMRDLLLGLSFVNGQGKLIIVGGRTVKNVAGYDATKLMVGSLGQLGMVTEATIKTSAVPAQVMTVDIAIDDPQVLDTFQTQWLLTEAAPVSVSLALENKRFIVRVCYAGTSSGCAIQLRSLKTLLEAYPGLHVVGHQTCTFAQCSAMHAAHRHWRRQSPAIVKILVPPASAGFVAKMLGEQIAGNPAAKLEAFPFHGCLFVGGDLTADQAVRLDQQINHVIQPVEGLRIWYERPSDAIDPFGSPTSEFTLLCKLKQTLDPHHIFNPGRYLKRLNAQK